MNEKRKHLRLPLSFWIHDKSGKKKWVTEDISVGGCFVKALENLQLGSKIDLVFQAPGSSHYIEATGQVRHLKAGGMGLEFVRMDHKEKDAVARFVKDFS